MIGGEAGLVERLRPLFEAIAPGVEAASRTPGRMVPPTVVERAYLHRGPAGAGHFVKTVQNGIEYGLMSETTRIAVLFDIDGTLLTTGGAGAASWRLAFDELYRIPADISKFTDSGMTDPEVGRTTFEAVLHRKPERKEFARLLERRLYYLHQTVAESEHYRVLPGVEELLPKLIDDGHLLGLVTGNLEAAAHIKLHRAQLNRFFSFGGYGSDSTDRGELTRIAIKRAALVYGEPLSTSQVIAVGDTPRDVEGAHAAGIACVGVASDKFSVDQLSAAGRRLRHRLADRRSAAMSAEASRRTNECTR
jgi:phosphoglycolate phosphatase